MQHSITNHVDVDGSYLLMLQWSMGNEYRQAADSFDAIQKFGSSEKGVVFEVQLWTLRLLGEILKRIATGTRLILLSVIYKRWQFMPSWLHQQLTQRVRVDVCETSNLYPVRCQLLLHTHFLSYKHTTTRQIKLCLWPTMRRFSRAHQIEHWVSSLG